MKTKKNIYSALTLIVFALLFVASAQVKNLSTTERTYAKTTKEPENITVTYNLPIITPTASTKQTQTKGGVIITTEIVTFTVNRFEKKDKTISYADPNKSGYDIYEVKNTPDYSVKCAGTDQVQFKIRIRNNEQVPLVLSQVGFSLGVDGVEFSFPTEYKEDWNKGLIMTGFEKEYNIKGPDLKGLYNAQVIRLFLNGVPTSYNEAGNITKKDNFEWFFECKSQNVQKQEQINYTYETSPIETKKCAKCSGTGTDPQAYKCSSCEGKGTRVNAYDGKTYTCSKCSGKGIVYIKCGNCNGRGENSYPKSQTAPITSSITWTGAQVQVVTNPPGAKVSVVNTKTKEYQSAGMSNVTVNWYSSDQKSYPIIIDYQGQTVKVLPYNDNGKLIPKVVIDFVGGSPSVTKGKKVN